MASDQPIDSLLDLLPLRENDHIRGGENAELTLVEYGDYECPACGEAYEVLKRIEAELAERMRYVFRHFPYARLHPHAEIAAQAAEAASDQGRFWEMHEALFSNPQALEIPDLTARAERLNLDMDRFRTDLESERLVERVRSDFRTGVQNGVFGTPGIFLNGVRHNDNWDYETLMGAIERTLETAKVG